MHVYVHTFYEYNIFNNYMVIYVIKMVLLIDLIKACIWKKNLFYVTQN